MESEEPIINNEKDKIKLMKQEDQQRSFSWPTNNPTDHDQLPIINTNSIITNNDQQGEIDNVFQLPTTQYKYDNNIIHISSDITNYISSDIKSYTPNEDLDYNINTDNIKRRYHNLGVKKPRRHAWGNLSYAEIITKAIGSSPEQRLTLSQIYDWMIKNIPYFATKSCAGSSAGWKVYFFL